MSVAPATFKGNWDTLPLPERFVLWLAYYADTIKVREEGGNNRGAWVRKFLLYVGFSDPQPWCAALMSDGAKNAGWTKFKSAAVLRWVAWGKSKGVIRSVPIRGAMAYWVRGKSRHIEGVIQVEGGPCPEWLHPSGKVPRGYVMTIGGNTSSGRKGSQNDGDGTYRRLRRISEFDGFIEWWRA